MTNSLNSGPVAYIGASAAAGICTAPELPRVHADADELAQISDRLRDNVVRLAEKLGPVLNERTIGPDENKGTPRALPVTSRSAHS